MYKSLVQIAQVCTLAFLGLHIVLYSALIVSTDVEYHDRILYVNALNGQDNESCLSGYKSSACKSLKFISDKLVLGSRNITIILDSPVKLNGSVIFDNCDGLTVKSENNFNKIDCNWNTGGISFIEINNLTILNMAIGYCFGNMDAYNSTLLLYKCSNIIISGVTMHNNTGSSAIVVINPFNKVNISLTWLIQNGGNNASSYASGLHVEFSEHTFATLTVDQCFFLNNFIPIHNTTATGEPDNWNGYSLGGGMGIILLKNSSGISIHINNSNFDNNTATWGGGLCIYVQQNTINNSIIVTNSIFQYNHGEQGGGGVQIRLGKILKRSRITIIFKNVTFMKDFGKFGGGTSITALYSDDRTEPGEILQFTNCTWTKNTAYISPAVDISLYTFQQLEQGYLPIPLLRDSIIEYNFVKHRHDPGKNTSYFITQGAFIVSNFFVVFQGYARFRLNKQSALYLTSATAIFDTNSKVVFQQNQGIKGGAVAMYGSSALVINDNSSFEFINNTATRVGGAISYIPFDQRELFAGRTCFLVYGGNKTIISQRDITFNFTENMAALGGLSIFSKSLLACYYKYLEKYTKALDFIKFFKRIGTFTFDSPKSGIFPLATAARSVRFEGGSYLEVIPGDRLPLPLAMYDEFKHIIHSEYALRVEGASDVHLDNDFTVTNETHIYGKPNQMLTLILSTPETMYNIDYHLRIMLLSCSPGFYFNELSQSCECSANNDSHAYPAITKCIKFTALIKHGYWVGYYPSNNTSPDHLYTALYSSHFDGYEGLLTMPKSAQNLSNFSCEELKEGVLCGKCTANHSAYYPLEMSGITCGKNEKCKFGLLFYTLSELIPMIIFFVFIMISGVNFSSGNLNGFVFFSQVVDTVAYNQLHTQSKYTTLFTALQSGHRLMYGILNFNYFPNLPFCLWKGATVMTVIVFKYVTFTIAFVLILLTVFVMNYSTKCNSMTFCNKIRRRSSVTHGISTVLIICYGQCTRVGFFILTKANLRGMEGIEPVPVTYYGGLLYFENEHLPYAVVAIIFTILIVGLPPLCLLMYPLLFHLLELCGLSEHKFVEKVSRTLCINRLLPLFDSFQSCYKDKMRYFAGIYFLYRVVAYFGYLYRDTIPPMYLAVLILGIHSILQPYRSQKHNVFDALLFLNIATINSLTIMIKFSLINGDTKKPPKLVLVQLFFIYLPILVLFLILSLKLCRKLCRRCKGMRYHWIEDDAPKEKVTHSSINVHKPLILQSSVQNYM